MTIKHIETFVRSAPSVGVRRGIKSACLYSFLMLQFD